MENFQVPESRQKEEQCRGCGYPLLVQFWDDHERPHKKVQVAVYDLRKLVEVTECPGCNEPLEPIARLYDELANPAPKTDAPADPSEGSDG